MAKIALSAPITLDPQTSSTITLKTCMVDFENRRITIGYQAEDGNGNALGQRTAQVSAADVAAVGTWMDNHQATIVTRLLAKLGVSGNVVA